MLSVSQLTFGYVSAPLLKDLSFEIGPGELVHIKGPNGVGKSTLLALVAGLLQPDSGSIKFGKGTRSEYLPAEGNGHYLKLDAKANLTFWLGLHGRSLEDKILADELAYWRLNPIIIQNKVPVEQYSTGMKRKLALARVRLSGAQLWMLDEPVSGLDDFALQQFTTMLATHLSSGGSALVVSHDLAPIKAQITRTLNIGDACG